MRYGALLLGLLLGLVPVIPSLKRLPQALFLGLFALHAAVGSRLPRLSAIFLALVIFAAATFAWMVALLALFPAVTADGHGVMPIGQAFFGLILGALSGAFLSASFLRGARERTLESHVLNLVGAALLAAALLTG